MGGHQQLSLGISGSPYRSFTSSTCMQDRTQEGGWVIRHRGERQWEASTSRRSTADRGGGEGAKERRVEHK